MRAQRLGGTFDSRRDPVRGLVAGPLEALEAQEALKPGSDPPGFRSPALATTTSIARRHVAEHLLDVRAAPDEAWLPARGTLHALTHRFASLSTV